jgi:protein-S-isoprenylcysteine O-methyltransferase Ste14
MGRDSVERQQNLTATAGVVSRPIRLFPAIILLGLALDRLLTLPFMVPGARRVPWLFAGPLLLAGLALFVAGVRNFARAATPLPTNRPARVLVTTGIHGRTRNPIYLGFFLMYAGIGIALQSPWTLILIAPLAVTIRYGVIAREEAYLEGRFGDAYLDYKARVRRWL